MKCGRVVKLPRDVTTNALFLCLVIPCTLTIGPVFVTRRVAARKRALLARFAARASSATKLQSAWRGKMARDSYLRARCSWLASREIQRMYRGHLGRRATRRRREWQSAGPGPERLKLGLRMIEDTKVGRDSYEAYVCVRLK